MLYCDYCKVHISGKGEKCPLCGNIIPKDNEMTDKDITDTFPTIPLSYEKHLIMKIMIFVSIAAVTISFAIETMFPTRINWPILVLLGLISMWLCLIIIIQKTYHISKKIIWMVVIVSILSLFWDWNTGWKGWSINYVIPIACMSAMILMYITAKILKLSVNDYITYALIDAIFGIIPLSFIIFGWVNVIYPSVISVASSIITLAAIFIFQGDNIKAELHKRMHI